MSGAKSGAEPRLVTPGEVIETSLEMRSGVGITYENNQYISTRIGWLRENNGTLSVDPIQGSYMPRSGDLVIGYIEAVRNNLWFAEINGAFNGLLPMSLAPWKVEFGAARQHMDIGDVIIARVQEVDESHSVVLTMKGVGLRKLKNGCVESIGVQLLDKFRGPNNEHVRNMASISDTRIVVGENGRIWIDGEPEGIQSVREFIQFTKQCGHHKDFITQFQEKINKTRGDQ